MGRDATPHASARPLGLPALVLGLAGLVLALVGAGCGPDTPERGVVLVTVDTLRADHLSAYGFGLRTSPAVDALAESGVLFERAIAASAATAPSHASILTGRHVRGHSVGYSNGQTRLGGVTTLAERFRGAGWDTAAFVGNVVLQRRIGLDRGFDVYDDELPHAEGVRAGVYERRARATTERALAWLEQRGPAPFFLWVHYQDPHGPYAAPEPWGGRFRGDLTPPMAERELPVLDDESGLGGIPAYQALPGVTRPSAYRARYAEEIRFADHWIGNLLGGVAAAAPDAVVLLTADHGEAFGEHGRYFVHFHTTTPENAHVPFVLRAPGLPRGERRTEVVHHVDVVPTLLELAGLPVPDDAPGVALGPVLRGERALPERYVYCDRGVELTAYRGDRFLRIDGMITAWQEGADPPSRRATVYTWPRRGGWRRAGAEEPLPDAAWSYATRAVPMEIADSLDRTGRERLRALGYLHDDDPPDGAR